MQNLALVSKTSPTLPKAILSLLFGASWMIASAQADSVNPAVAVPSEESAFELIQKKLRIRTFSELMSPAFQNSQPSVPDSNGSQLLPTNLYNIALMDYEVAPNYRVVYWQRVMVYLAPDNAVHGGEIVLRNPRFAIRRTHVFDVANLDTTYDLYIQPGLAPESISAGRSLEVGFRTNTSYVFPASKWSIGVISEFTTAFSDHGGSGSDVYGWFMPWASYDISKTFSTQHYFSFNYQHMRGDRWNQFEMDYPLPYVQNGIGVNVTKNIWASVLLNNYVFTLPTLQNTWASLWLSMTIL